MHAGDAADPGIAVVGLACRFPGAPDTQAFWRNLCAGVESISRFTKQELIAAGAPMKMIAQPRYVNAGGCLQDAECFDADFFGYSRREAEMLDPQHRLFLQCAWTAIEDAGYPPTECPGAVGVFGGAGMSTHIPWLDEVAANDPFSLSGYQVMLAGDKDFLCTRVAYKLGLRGPAVTVQTACSTSLVAVHLACQSLLLGESDMALAGGVSVRLPSACGYLFAEGMIFSPDGHCRTFDAAAGGIVPSNGVGIVVLKRLGEALADGDRIRGVIRGTAINNDGADKAGFTAPSVNAQAAVIAEALRVAGVSADTIGYIEAHGTGTPVGDPIEIRGLTQAFRQYTSKTQYCAIGSVKTNIGHTDTAAGVAGLIKAILALQHRRIPASLHFRQANPEIDFARSPFHVNQALTEWPAPADHPRRAGVSSFGIGGTNAHAVVEEPPE